MNWRHLLYALFHIIVILETHAQSDSLFVIPKIDGITFDGRVDETEWNSIAPVPMVQYEPNAGSPPTEKTEIRIAYDAKYIYVSMRAYDRDPNGIWPKSPSFRC